MGEFDTKNERWLHKTDYFKYVIQSDIIFLAIDSNVLEKGDISEILTIENSMIAAIQLIFENKGVIIDRKLKSPIALIFMKSDLVSPSELTQLPYKLPRLINLCEKRCLNFKFFITSSVGYITEDGLPPSKIEPFNVTEPIIWALSHI